MEWNEYNTAIGACVINFLIDENKKHDKLLNNRAHYKASTTINR